MNHNKRQKPGRFRRKQDKFYVSADMEFFYPKDNEWEHNTIQKVITAESSQKAIGLFVTRVVIPIVRELHDESVGYKGELIRSSSTIRVSKTGFWYNNDTVQNFDAVALFNRGVIVEVDSPFE